MHTKQSYFKYRLLVLMDLSKASLVALDNAIQLAEVVNGNVEVFHVKAPTDVVRYENQYSAITEIHEDYHNTMLRLRKIITNAEKKNHIQIKYQMAYGNIKIAIKEHIDKVQPDIILLGKRKSKFIDFLSNGITKFVLKHSTSNILIAGESYRFHSYSDISLGIYGKTLRKHGFQIINDLNQKGTKPTRIFNIGNKKESENELLPNKRNVVSYVFSEGANTLDAIASYVSKTNTQLFCIPRNSTNDRTLLKLGKVETPIKGVINKLNIPILFLR